MISLVSLPVFTSLGSEMSLDYITQKGYLTEGMVFFFMALEFLLFFGMLAWNWQVNFMVLAGGVITFIIGFTQLPENAFKYVNLGSGMYIAIGAFIAIGIQGFICLHRVELEKMRSEAAAEAEAKKKAVPASHTLSN